MSKLEPNKLLISSDFYSVQGEGISTGIPSYFVRLALCNLNCGMSRAFTNDLLKKKNLEDGEIFVGDLQAEGLATWTCDSTSQWLWRGENKHFQYLIEEWNNQGIYEKVLKGLIHIIWTGGEPTIKGHQISILNFVEYWNQLDHEYLKDLWGEGRHLSDIKFGYHEIETNGTNLFTLELFSLIDQINCSPKLKNSGMDEKQRIHPEVIHQIKTHKNYQFKFVISTEEDIKEMFDTYVNKFNIPLHNVVCMPGMDQQDQYFERTQWVLEMAKKYGFRGMSRLHIAAWDRVINV